MAAYSLLAPNLISSNPKALNLSSSSLFFSKPTNHLFFSSSNSHFLPVLRKGRGLDLSIVRRVAAYSEVDDEEEEEVSFSPDLKLFVGNLPFSVDSSELAELFQNAGTVEKVEVIYDKQSGNSRGFGFVTMSTVEEVETAAQQFNGYELDGRALRVNSGPPPRREEFPSRGFRSGGSGGGFDAGNSRSFRSGGGGGGFDAGNSRSFRSRGGGGSSDAGNRLYVGNLSWGVDNVALESLFREQGNVTDARVVYDRESGRSRGFGFVTYNTAAEANNAISSLDGSDLDGRSIRVSMAEARPPRREF